MRFHIGFALLALLSTGSFLDAQEPAKKSLRVLLATGGATREFQFAEAVFVRAEQTRDIDLAVWSGAPGAANVPQKPFPNLLRPADRVDAADKARNLAQYDVVIAFDVDWTRVEPESLILLQKWVERGGGLIFLAGGVNTPALTRAKAEEVMQPLRELLPVVFHDPQNQPALPVNRVPVRLTFGENKPAAPFLKLRADGKTDRAGWDDFFGGPKEKVEKPVRGFFSCFPVESTKKGAVALATFEVEGQKEPWLALHTVDKGRVIWIGSLEVWRLRQYSEAFHERLWLEMTRSAAAGRLR